MFFRPTAGQKDRHVLQNCNENLLTAGESYSRQPTISDVNCDYQQPAWQQNDPHANPHSISNNLYGDQMASNNNHQDGESDPRPVRHRPSHHQGFSYTGGNAIAGSNDLGQHHLRPVPMPRTNNTPPQQQRNFNSSYQYN